MEPAIKNGIFALGAVHRHYYENSLSHSPSVVSNLTTARHGAVALEYYFKAVGHARKLLADSEKVRDQYGLVKNKDVAFMTCIMFVSFESIAGDPRVSMMHLRSAFRILDEAERKKRISDIETNMTASAKAAGNGREARTPSPTGRVLSPAPSPLQTSITHLLRRLDLQSMMIDRSGAAQSDRPSISCAALEADEPAPIPSDFSHGGMAEASSHLIDMVRWIVKIGELWNATRGAVEKKMEMQGEIETECSDRMWNPSSPGSKELLHVNALLERSKRRMCYWREAFERTRAHQTPDEYHRDTPTAQLLEIYEVVSRLMVECANTGKETSWDSKMDEIEPAINLAESLITSSSATLLPQQGGGGAGMPDYQQSSTSQYPGTYVSLEMGVIFPLKAFGFKCRDPILRRKIVKLLGTPPRRREAMMDSFVSAMMVQRSMEIEEEGARQYMAASQGLVNGVNGLADYPHDISVKRAEDIPEHARVYLAYPDESVDGSPVSARFITKPDGKNWLMTREFFS